MHLELPSRDTVGSSVRFDLPSQLYLKVAALDRLQEPAICEREPSARIDLLFGRS